MFKIKRKPYQGFDFFGRLKALSVHLIFSLVIFIVFIWVMLVYWFPQPHFSLNGGWQGVRIMVLVDLVIGPLLTFFLYNTCKSKKELRFDLGLIIVIQFALLVYGITTVYSQRPVVQVLSYQGFIATPRLEDLVYDRNKVRNPVNYINSLNMLGITPPLVYGKDGRGKIKIFDFDLRVDKNFKRKEELIGELYPEKIVSQYEPINSLYAQSKLREVEGIGFITLLKSEANIIAIKNFLSKNEGDFYFFRFIGEYGKAVMVLDSRGKPVDYFNIEKIDEIDWF